MENTNKKKSKHPVKSSNTKTKTKATPSRFWKLYTFFRSNYIVTTLLVVLLGAFVLKYYEDVHFSYSNFKKTDVDIYEVLEVSKDAKDPEIKAKYRELSLKWHPDKNKDCPECEERFLKIKEAYKIILNPSLREMYDKTKGHTVEMIPSKTTNLTMSNYNRLVKNSNKVWVLQVYSDDNHRCRSFAPLWDEFATKFEKFAKFGRVNALLEEKLLSKLPIKPQLYPSVFLLFPNKQYDLMPLSEMENIKSLTKYFYENYPFYGTKLDDYAKFRVFEGRKLLLYSDKTNVSLSLKFLTLKFHKVLKVFYVHSPEHYSKDELLLDDMKNSNHLPQVPDKLELYDLFVGLYDDAHLKYASYQLTTKFQVLQPTLYALLSLDLFGLNTHTYETLCSRFSSKDRLCLLLPENQEKLDLEDVYNKYETFNLLLRDEVSDEPEVVDEDESPKKTKERLVSLVDLQFLKMAPNHNNKYMAQLYHNFYYPNTKSEKSKKMTDKNKNNKLLSQNVLLVNKNKQMYTLVKLKELNSEFVVSLLNSSYEDNNLRWVEFPSSCKGDLFKSKCLNERHYFNFDNVTKWLKLLSF